MPHRWPFPILPADTPIPSGVPIIRETAPAVCDLCGKVAELRPYGPNGENVCFPCGMKNEAAATEKFKRRIFP